MTHNRPPALLALEDGTTWPGFGFGTIGETTGEVVFNTSMTGYQEVITDPSYHGQIVVMTASHIGNVGCNPEDDESARAWVAGFVVRELSPVVSNYRARQSLDEYLRERGVVAITGVATRPLVKHIRTHGAMRAAMSSENTDAERLIELARRSRPMSGADLAREVTCAEPYHWSEGVDVQWYPGMSDGPTEIKASGPLVVAYDFGIKRNILRLLTSRGCRVRVVPATTPASDVLAMKPDGIFLSNGPGDPAACDYAIAATRELLGKAPMFGICLGHQIIGLALGGQTYKLKFGHRGGNQPVGAPHELGEERAIEISSHNHGFAVQAESLPPHVEITHVNLNDGCVEGLRVKALRVFSVQYHPEASPGPHDAGYLFDEFIAAMRTS
ncbi:MAG: glutamine-hydrolyzing carbamoyl-phosphate synthase small subunit [Anaerolineae bacterium]|nr:glutamine-hydrolyzing carbamoyl-phosphate synthase small subunit [Thermoflexales bacterium]MDW8406970.1 glutamine-hydrolyzing carbamoyl-phosphate synthase small subunit [Anaerolineae bacterium]